jgi:Ca2+-binding RTX toxin-like protein
MLGGGGDDGLVGDSAAPSQGAATGAGDDILFGEQGADFLIGDGEGVASVNGSGGDDILDLGTDGGVAAIGDHNVNDPAGGPATGSGNDRIIGGSSGEVLIGDSSIADASVTTAGNDFLEGRGGEDTVFGDNTDFDASMSVGEAGGTDWTNGGSGVDSLKGGPNNDFLNGGAGRPDSCDGEAGTDAAIGCEAVSNVP